MPLDGDFGVVLVCHSLRFVITMWEFYKLRQNSFDLESLDPISEKT